MTELMQRRRALMGAKGELPILNPSVGLTENAKLHTNVSAPYITQKTGAAVTDFIDAGTSGNFVFLNPNTPSLWESPNDRLCGKILQYSRNDQNAQFTDNWNCAMSGAEKRIAVTTQKRYVRLALPMENLAGVYAYNSATGQVFYAGINTPYYGKKNIND